MNSFDGETRTPPRAAASSAGRRGGVAEWGDLCRAAAWGQGKSEEAGSVAVPETASAVPAVPTEPAVPAGIDPVKPPPVGRHGLFEAFDTWAQLEGTLPSAAPMADASARGVGDSAAAGVSFYAWIETEGGPTGADSSAAPVPEAVPVPVPVPEAKPLESAAAVVVEKPKAESAKPQRGGGAKPVSRKARTAPRAGLFSAVWSVAGRALAEWGLTGNKAAAPKPIVKPIVKPTVKRAGKKPPVAKAPGVAAVVGREIGMALAALKDAGSGLVRQARAVVTPVRRAGPAAGKRPVPVARRSSS